jgi:two-component system, NarL family, nitrate/nitrite response regulator NarL
VVGEAADCDGAVDAVVSAHPDVCLLDVDMPGGGIETARRVGEAVPETSVVMLTVSTNTEDLLEALRAGAVGYLPKDTSPERLPAALRGVLKGEAALPRTLVGRVLKEFRTFAAAGVASPVRVGAVQLTPRESEILRMLSLSPVTVRRHISAGVTKLGVADRDAAIRAIEPLAAA